ncbi:MAG: vitamin K epoxide reductase family protein [Muribaculum sp.]|nr:vitamin K epoxide reductase family protein [Muribaculum sp.]
MDGTTILSDLLEELGVPFTAEYSDRQFEAMPFKSLFGLANLLKSYHIQSEGLLISDKSEIVKLPTPFIAKTSGGLVIVKSIGGDGVSYLTQGVAEQMPLDEFRQAWDSTVMLLFPETDAEEPDYCKHREKELFTKVRNVGLVVCLALLFGYLFISNGIYRHISTVLLTLFNIAGFYLTYLLVQKSLKINNKAADKVCRVLQEGGCDSILSMGASKFFGIFGWSEVGFTYFSVSLLCLLIFPQWTCYLAACNACCLPFTVWSIWYQKFRAKVWCTLCVSVQCTLWLLFFCYLGGGWFRGIFPLRVEFFVLGLTYLTVLFALNKLLPKFDKSEEI